MKEKIKLPIEFFRRDKRRLLLLALAAVGLLFALMLPSGGKDSAKEGVTLSEYKAALEEELAEMCSSIEGVGRCRVTVSFSAGESLQYKGSQLIGSTPPRVLGVSVVCEGAERDGVRSEISECMRALFDIGANRVSVMKMK